MAEQQASRRRGLVAGSSCAVLVLCLSTPAAAEPSLARLGEALRGLDTSQLAALALFLGTLAALVATSVLLVRSRASASAASAAHATERMRLQNRLDEAEALLAADPAVVVTWRGPAATPELQTDVTLASVPNGPRLLAFGTWLPPDSARRIEERIEQLRTRGEAFALILKTLEGHFLSAEGRAIGDRVVLRLRDVTEERRARAELEHRTGELEGALRLLHRLLDAVDQPAWIRDAEGRLAWANRAYARAVEAPDGAVAAKAGLEFLDSAIRGEVVRARLKQETFRRRLAAVVAGARHVFDVVDVPAEEGSAGLAVDISDLEALRAEMSRRIEAHRRTLDELATAVAIFRSDGTLDFFNQAYRQLWQLDPGFLDQSPTDSAILDLLRASRRLPEQSDFRSWKETLHQAYRALEPKEHWWHLPDGRTLRVVASPNPEGGVTYLFDDVTERLDLQSRYNALIRVQSETLDHLGEAVAVFGSDGRLKLFNPAFAKLWKLPPAELSAKPHVGRIVELASVLHEDDAFWERLKATITAMPEQRTPIEARIERRDGSVIDVVTVPLPDGATMTTFLDVTASVQIERALRDRNDALEAAAQLKNAFVKHVSYELRSPLTNIIGFTQLLGEEHVGPLTEKQREYAGHVLASSAALLAIINDILDLATIDAGGMELQLDEVDIRSTMEAAAEGVRDRLVEGGVVLDITASAEIGSFLADGKRVRQILFNLLSNAIGFSSPGQTITLTAGRENGDVVFTVTDEGAGIPPERLERVFDRFESHTAGSAHRGVGLGLSIVRSFVELHGGTVTIDSVLGRGTIVSCRFPARRAPARVAAA